MKSLLVFLITLLNAPAPVAIPAKEPLPVYPTKDFRSPLDIPMSLAGNYGEPRRLHFHSGLDFRTNQVEGLNVYAVADGYVSRINVSGSGYGKALYITHNNGYTTVYGHLQRFSDKIEKRLQQEQYSKESFSVDFVLKKNELPVTQSEIVAYSGNTGGSGGPHLHFEVRDSLERAINPLLFGFKLLDNIKPTMAYIKFYPQDEKKYYSNGYRVRTIGTNGIFQVAGNVVNLNANRVSFSVNTTDKINGSGFTMGVYGMKMFVDGQKKFEFNMNRMMFSERRNVIAHIDYPIFMNENRHCFHKCFVEPADECSIYNDVQNRGLVDLSDGKPKAIKIEIYDFAGNISTCEFTMQKSNTAQAFKTEKLEYDQMLFPFKQNEFKNNEISISIPPKMIFDTVPLKYKRVETDEQNFFSAIHQLGKVTTLLLDYVQLKLKTTKPLPAGQAEKAVVVWKNEHGNWVSKGGIYDGKMLTTTTREFGDYSIQIDTTPPRITAINIAPEKYMRLQKTIVFKIADNLSGIKSYKTYIDNKFVISEYDAKTARLFHRLDSNLAVGNHEFKIVVKDERNNEAIHIVPFKM